MIKNFLRISLLVFLCGFTVFAAAKGGDNVDYTQAFNQLVTAGSSESEALQSLLADYPGDVENIIAQVVGAASSSDALGLINVALQSVPLGKRQAVVDGGLRAGIDQQTLDNALASNGGNSPGLAGGPPGLGPGPHGNRRTQTPGVTNRGRGGGGGSPG